MPIYAFVPAGTPTQYPAISLIDEEGVVVSGRPPMAITIPIFTQASAVQWTDMPAATTELLGSSRDRTKYDFTNVRQARLICRVASPGVAGALLEAQYSTDDSTFVDTGISTLIDSSSTSVSAWINIPTAMKADVFIRVVGKNGNGIADPSFAYLVMQVK